MRGQKQKKEQAIEIDLRQREIAVTDGDGFIYNNQPIAAWLARELEAAVAYALAMAESDYIFRGDRLVDGSGVSFLFQAFRPDEAMPIGQLWLTYRYDLGKEGSVFWGRFNTDKSVIEAEFVRGDLAINIETLIDQAYDDPALAAGDFAALALLAAVGGAAAKLIGDDPILLEMQIKRGDDNAQRENGI